MSTLHPHLALPKIDTLALTIKQTPSPPPMPAGGGPEGGQAGRGAGEAEDGSSGVEL
jgi:hypothetical protein